MKRKPKPAIVFNPIERSAATDEWIAPLRLLAGEERLQQMVERTVRMPQIDLRTRFALPCADCGVGVLASLERETVMFGPRLKGAHISPIVSVNGREFVERAVRAHMAEAHKETT